MVLEKIVEQSRVTVKGIEKGKDKKITIILDGKKGEYSVMLPDNIARKLWIGDKLQAGFIVLPSSLTDFIGRQPEPYDEVTMHYEIRYLRTPDGDCIYKRPTPSARNR